MKENVSVPIAHIYTETTNTEAPVLSISVARHLQEVPSLHVMHRAWSLPSRDPPAFRAWYQNPYSMPSPSEKGHFTECRTPLCGAK